MKGRKRVDEIAKTGAWKCHRCLRGRRKSLGHLAAYTTKPGKLTPWTFFAPKASQPRRSLYESNVLEGSNLGRSMLSIFTANRRTSKAFTWNQVFESTGKRRGMILTILAVGSLWIFSDDAKHRYMAMKRTLRVFNALVRCLREYIQPYDIRHHKECYLHS